MKKDEEIEILKGEKKEGFRKRLLTEDREKKAWKEQSPIRTRSLGQRSGLNRSYYAGKSTKGFAEGKYRRNGQEPSPGKTDDRTGVNLE